MRILLDHGSQEAATLLLPWEDVPDSDAKAPPTHVQDPVHGLVEADEATLSLYYLTDTPSCNKMQAERAKALTYAGRGASRGSQALEEWRQWTAAPRKNNVGASHSGFFPTSAMEAVAACHLQKASTLWLAAVLIRGWRRNDR